MEDDPTPNEWSATKREIKKNEGIRELQLAAKNFGSNETFLPSSEFHDAISEGTP